MFSDFESGLYFIWSHRNDKTFARKKKHKKNGHIHQYTITYWLVGDTCPVTCPVMITLFLSLYVTFRYVGFQECFFFFCERRALLESYFYV